MASNSFDGYDFASGIGDSMLTFASMLNPAFSILKGVKSNVESAVSGSGSTISDFKMWQQLGLQMAMNKAQQDYEQQVYQQQLADQKEMIADQREYDQMIYEKYNSPSAQREQKVAAGINPLWEDFAGNAAAVSSPSSVPSMHGAPNGIAPDLAAFEQADAVQRNSMTQKYGLFAKIAETAADLALRYRADNRDEKRLANETQSTAASVAEKWSSIDKNDAMIRQIEQTTSNLLQENRKNDYELSYLGSVLSAKVERELLQNSLMRSEDNYYQHLGALLKTQNDREEFAKNLDKIMYEDLQLQYKFDRKTFNDRVRITHANRQITEEEYSQLKLMYDSVMAISLQSQLDMLQTQRKIDIESLNDTVMREIEAQKYENLSADLRAHVGDMILERAGKLANIFSQSIDSYSVMQGNQIRLYNARTRRAEFGVKPYHVPNSMRRGINGELYNPDASWMK